MDSQSKPLLPKAYDSIRISQSDRGTTVSYPLRLNLRVRDFLGRLIIAVIGLGVVLLISPSFLGDMLFTPGGRLGFGALLVLALVSSLFLTIFLLHHEIVQFLFGKAKFTVEDGWLICRHRPLPSSKEGGRVKLTDIDHVVVGWASADKDKGFRYQLVANPPKGMGTPKVLIDSIDPDAGRALCTALHEHLGVPVGN